MVGNNLELAVLDFGFFPFPLISFRLLIEMKIRSDFSFFNLYDKFKKIDSKKCSDLANFVC